MGALLVMGFLALLFIAVPGFVVLAIVLSLRAGRRSAAARAAAYGQPYGRARGLDWLPEPDGAEHHRHGHHDHHGY